MTMRSMDDTGYILCRGDGLWHRPTAEDPDAWWRPIACGDGINLPGPEYSAEQVVEQGGDLCPACLAAPEVDAATT